MADSSVRIYASKQESEKSSYALGSVSGSKESREPRRSRANTLLKPKCVELCSEAFHKRPQDRQISQELSLGISGPGSWV